VSSNRREEDSRGLCTVQEQKWKMIAEDAVLSRKGKGR
jgi:hypothetical protein